MENSVKKINMLDAVQLFFKNYFNFYGRSSRSEFWWFVLAYFIVAILAVCMDAIMVWYYTISSVYDGMDYANPYDVYYSPMLGAASLGMEMHYAIPRGFEPDENIVSRAKDIAKETGGTVEMTHNPVEAVKGANVVYTDVFISMGEEKMKDKIEAFDGFQVNEELVSNADSDYIFMHCLPAHRGEEVTDEVIDSKNSVVFDQAENRMWAQMSLMTFLVHPAAWEAYSELH